jgi:hypothetical protein
MPSMGSYSMNDRRDDMRLKSMLLAIGVFVVPVAAMAQDHKEKLIQELYVKSGLEKQVGQLPMLIQLGFDETVAAESHFKAMPQSEIREIRASIETVFAPGKLKKTILSECRDKLSIGDLKSVLEWLKSPIGTKLTQLEETASTPEKYSEMQQYALQLQKSPPPPERLKTIQQLDSAMKATETGVEVAMNTQLAVAMGVVASLPQGQQPPNDHLVATIEQTRPQVEDATRAETLVSFLYTYSSVTSEELGRYMAFASSPAGNNYHNATISGLKKALLEGGYEWGRIIADIIKQSASKTHT